MLTPHVAVRHARQKTHGGSANERTAQSPSPPQALLPCPNTNCLEFNRFGAGNPSAWELMGKGRRIRRLYGKRGGERFSGRLAELGLGRVIKAPRLERLNGTACGQQPQPSRRTRQSTRQVPVLGCSLPLRRGLQNWIWPLGSCAKGRRRRP